VRSVNDLALDLVGPAAIVPQATSASTNVTLGHADGLSIVQRLDSGEQINVLLKQICEVHEVLSSLLG